MKSHAAISVSMIVLALAVLISDPNAPLRRVVQFIRLTVTTVPSGSADPNAPGFVGSTSPDSIIKPLQPTPTEPGAIVK